MKKYLKYIILISVLPLTFLILGSTEHTPKISEMEMKTFTSSIGEIAYEIQEVGGSIPIVFLHGVYYDHRLWDYHTERITTHTTISIDMPLHGKSKDITKENWTMEDCANMLIEILDELGIEKCYAIGHSWGSMTILRAASQHPDRFLKIGLCNMPLEKGGVGAKLQFGFQHSILGFRNFYTKQVAKAMFSKESRKEKPEIVEYLSSSMGQLSNKDLKKTDKTVITKVGSGFPFLDNLTVPAIALRGKDDYVPTPENIRTILVDGKHTSPLEKPEEVMKLISDLISQ